MHPLMVHQRMPHTKARGVFFVDLYTKGRNSQRWQKGGGAHKRQGAGSFSGRAVVSRCASTSVMLFPLIYCSVTCSTQAQFAMNRYICGMPGLACSDSPDRQNALRANKLLHPAFAVYGCMCYTKGNTAQFPPCGLSTAPAAAARHLRCQNAR